MKKLILMIGTCALGVVFGATFYVDSAATQVGDGSVVKPWRTVEEALVGVRSARVKGEAVEVCLLPGDYPVENSLTFTAADSGTAENPVVWRSLGGKRARLTHGVRLTAKMFRKVEDNATLVRLPEEARGKVWVADLNELVTGKIPDMALAFGGTPTAPLLWTGGQLGTLARWPNSDYTSFTKAVDKGGVVVHNANGSTVCRPGAFIYDNPRAKRWNFDAGVWMNGYWTHDWDNHSVKAATFGVENGTNNVIRLAANIPYGIMGGTWGRQDRRFYVFNLLEELDMPGEWYLDRSTKKLYLFPKNGVPTDADETTLVFSGEPIVRLSGAAFVHFDRLQFEYTYGDGMVVGNGANNIMLTDCRVANCGGTGVSFAGNHNVMRGVEICQVGRAGMWVYGGNRKTLTKAESLIEGCHIHDWALFQRTYAAAIHVDGCGITLRYNKMHDAPHSAVLYGGNDHVFEYNEVYRVLMETGDAGAYYTGRDWTTMGNVLRYNYTHDLGAEGEHANTMGFYFDDCDCGDAVYGNVFHNVARGIMVGGGREHPIKSNIFSKCKIGLSIDCRGMTWKHWNSVSVGGSSWLLEDKAKAFNYKQGIWAERYPLLAKIMDDHPREPLYDPVENNLFIDCTREILALDGAATACLSRMAPIAGNVVVYTAGTNNVQLAKIDGRIKDGFKVLAGTLEGIKNEDLGIRDEEMNLIKSVYAPQK